MSSFFVALNAVMPFLCYIGFGYLIRVLGLVDKPFLDKLNRMVFRALFPIMMFYNVYSNQSGLSWDWLLVGVAIGGLIILIGILFLTVPRIVPENEKRGVIIQGIYCSNFVLYAIPLAENVFGAEGCALASMLVAVTVPFFNVTAVLILEYFHGGKVSPMVLLKNVLQNPLIMGAVVGFLFIGLGIQVPTSLETPLSQFSGMTTPLALMILGGTLTFSSLREHIKYLIPAVSVKLILVPAVMVLISAFLPFSPMKRFVLFTIYATPVAAASYPMAMNMGGDGPLAGELVVVSTACSVVTIFLWIFL